MIPLPLQIILKVFFVGSVVVFVSTYGAKLPKIGALIISLPIITIATMILMTFQNEDPKEIARFSINVAFLVLPSLVYPVSYWAFVKYAELSSWFALGVSFLPAVIAYLLFWPMLRS